MRDLDLEDPRFLKIRILNPDIPDPYQERSPAETSSATPAFPPVETLASTYIFGF